MVMSCAALVADIEWAKALNPRSSQWIHAVMFTYIRHCGCIVPSAVAKAMEVEVGASLPKNARIEFNSLIKQ